MHYAGIPLFSFPQDSALTSLRQELQSQRQALAEKEEQVRGRDLYLHSLG